MNRIDILNSLIQRHNFKKYCEIGVQAGHCFHGVQCEYKVGVDPDTGSAATIHKPSDEFFSTLDEKFDIFWIDGLHHADQVERDILNALAHLNEGGFICCHDMLPTSKRMQEIPLEEQGEWTGNCWEAWVKLRTWRSDLTMEVVNTDWGVGIIHRGSQEILMLGSTSPNAKLTYEDFMRYRDHWMNVISIGDFKRKYLGEF